MSFSSWFRTLTLGIEARAVMRPIYETERTAIADLPENAVGRISGTVGLHDGRTIVAPISQRPCVMWKLRVHASNLDWRRQAAISFTLVENGHRALVDPATAHTILTPSYKTVVELMHGDDYPLERTILAEIYATELHDLGRGSNPTPIFGFQESIVQAGQPLCAVGSGIREHDREHATSYRDGNTLLVMAGEVALTDDPKYAVVSMLP